MAQENPADALKGQSLFEIAGWREHFKMSRAVLLVVDAQNDVLDEKGTLNFWQVWKHARENKAVENLKGLIPACREAGIPVIWAKQYRLAKGRDVFPGTWDGDSLALIRALIPDAFMQDTWETEIFDDLAELVDPKDIVIGKHGSSMFEGTTLEKYLKNLGAGVILTTGFLTDFCVEATVRSACDRGYLAVTVRDACATENEEIHQKALHRMERLIGPVVSTEEVLGLIRDVQAPPLPEETREYDLQEISSSIAEGVSLNDIVDWKRYLKRERTALLVVDPQNDNLHENGSLRFIESWRHARETGAVENVKRLVKACREKGIKIFWIKQNRLPQGKDIFPGTFDGKVMDLIRGVLPDAFLGGTWDTDIYDDLKPFIRDDEILIEKAGWSAFEATPLERYLNLLGANTLIVCGFLTDFCVEATARSASDKGYCTIVASDACAASSRDDHETALARFNRLIGPVVTTERLVEFIKGLRARTDRGKKGVAATPKRVTRAGPVTWEGLKQELVTLPKETLAEMVNVWLKTYWTLQNYWMVFTEQLFGFENAAKMDGLVWEKVAPAQAYRTVKVLGLGNDMQALAALLKFTAPQWVSAGFEWAFTEVSDTRLKMVIHACPMGTFRKAQDLELLPCKNLAPPLYVGLAKIINEKIEARCLHAHPDPPKRDVMCEWEFVLER